MKSLILIFIVLSVMFMTENISKYDVTESGDSVIPCHKIKDDSVASNTRQIITTQHNSSQDNNERKQGSGCRDVMIFWFISTDTYPYGLKN